jgi:hypothetical protein
LDTLNVAAAAGQRDNHLQHHCPNSGREIEKEDENDLISTLVYDCCLSYRLAFPRIGGCQRNGTVFVAFSVAVV